MKKNININSVPTIRVEVAKAPQTMQSFCKEQGMLLAATAVTSLVTGLVGAMCTRISHPRPKKVKMDKVEEGTK